MKRGETETHTLTGRRRIGRMRFTEWVNAPVQGTGADGLKLALALLWERRAECPGAVEVKRGKTWGYGLLWSPLASEYVEEEEYNTNVYLEDEPVSIKVYIDYRDLSADSYPQIYACGECAEEYSKYISEVDDLRPGEAARCEICGKENAAAREL